MEVDIPELSRKQCLNAVTILWVVRSPNKTHLASKLHLTTRQIVGPRHCVTKNASSESCSTVAIIQN